MAEFLFSQGSRKVRKEFTINEMGCLNKDEKSILIFFLSLDYCRISEESNKGQRFGVEEVRRIDVDFFSPPKRRED